MQVVDALGNWFGAPGVEITGPDGKPKTTGGGGGGPTGPAGGDLTGTYPNPGVNWSLGSPTYDLLYEPLLGFTPENVANKSNDATLGGLTPSSTLYPTQAAVKSYVDSSEYIMRHSFATPLDYIGVAPTGTAESSPVWNITRLTTTLSGTSLSQTATGAWTNRTSLIYT